MQLTSTSFAHPSVPGQRRAELWLSNDALVSAQQRLRDAGLEAFLLSTCLRVEVVVAGGPAQSAAVMAAVYGDAGASRVDFYGDTGWM